MLGKTLKSFVVAAAIAAGTLLNVQNTLALPLGQVDSFKLDQAWTGMVAGSLSGIGADWYTGYAFHFTSGWNTSAELYSFCIDPADASMGTVSNYYIQNPGNLSSRYSKSAWVLSQAIAGNANWVAAQAAVWAIMFDQYTPASLSSGQLSDVSKFIADAKNVDFTNFDFSGFYLALSPYNSPGRSFGIVSQDYLFYDPHPVPEPSTMLLLGCNLAGFVSLRRAYRRA